MNCNPKQELCASQLQYPFLAVFCYFLCRTKRVLVEHETEA